MFFEGKWRVRNNPKNPPTKLSPLLDALLAQLFKDITDHEKNM